MVEKTEFIRPKKSVPFAHSLLSPAEITQDLEGLG